MLERAFRLYENILDGRLHEVIVTDKMQYGFMLGRGTVDAALVLRKLTEKLSLFISCFLYLLIWKRLLRGKGVPEYLVDMVMSLYKGFESAFSVYRELSSLFSVKIGVHQISVLSPHLFIMVIDVLADDVKMVH